MNSAAMNEVRLINDDILSEILSHLPVKSLLRFKTVIKSWHDIIGSWAFTKQHLQNYCNNRSNNNCILVRVYDGNTDKWKLTTKFIDSSKLRGALTPDAHYFMESTPIIEIPYYPRIVGPIDGLICIHGIRPSTATALCNPSLAKTQFLPLSPVSSACHPNAYQRRVGFGFDVVHKDLKAVQLSLFSVLDSEFRVEVYSQSTNTWKELDHQIPNDMSITKAIMTYKNGSLHFSHWLAFTRFRRLMYFILSFNVQNEAFEQTPLPLRVHDAALRGQARLGFLAEHDSLLLLVDYSLGGLDHAKDVVFERWVLNGLGDGGRWMRLSSISIGPLVRVSEPLVVWKSDALVWDDWRLRHNLIFYSYCSREARNAIVIPPKQCASEVLGHKGSLISPAVFMKADQL